jgi:hypothetical protein
MHALTDLIIGLACLLGYYLLRINWRCSSYQATGIAPQSARCHNMLMLDRSTFKLRLHYYLG